MNWNERMCYRMAQCVGHTAEVPLYGMAAAERCLEEFDELLGRQAEFGSDTWHASRRLFDAHRIANMLLASDEAGTPTGTHIC